MQEIFGSVRRSLVFRSPTIAGDADGGGSGGGEDGTFVDKINSCIHKSRVFSKPSPPRLPPQMTAAGDNGTGVPPIRWRKGELIGCGAFGQVYMGMNLDSGELLAVKQVLIPANSASKEKAQLMFSQGSPYLMILRSFPLTFKFLRTLGTSFPSYGFLGISVLGMLGKDSGMTMRAKHLMRVRNAAKREVGMAKLMLSIGL